MGITNVFFFQSTASRTSDSSQRKDAEDEKVLVDGTCVAGGEVTNVPEEQNVNVGAEIIKSEGEDFIFHF